MAEELFDIVNDRDEVVGRAPRGEAHARGLRHRAVHVLVFNAAGQVFLQLRSLRKDTSPGCWDSSCSGHVDAGETYDAAALRELAEEIGISLPEPPARWFRVEAGPDTGWEFVWVYRLRHEGPFALPPEEIDRGEWCEPRDVARRIREQPEGFASSFRLIWARTGI